MLNTAYKLNIINGLYQGAETNVEMLSTVFLAHKFWID